MARPRNKQELLEQARGGYEKLILLVDGLSPEAQALPFPEGTLNRNIRDVLAHLHAWHMLMVDWYTVGMSGEKPKMPAKGYTWKTVPELNKEIHQRYSKVSLADVRSLLKQSYHVLLKIIATHKDEELFTKQKYHWTGSTSLGSYLISATSSHYDWAYKLIKKAKKRGSQNLASPPHN